MTPSIVQLIQLLAALSFIAGLKMMAHPKSAVRGNMLAAIGMLVAVVVTLLDKEIVSYGAIVIGIVIGGGVGAVMALRVKMTSMPQMVAILNGFGGAASAAVAGAELLHGVSRGEAGADAAIAGAGAAHGLDLVTLIAIAASALIGGVTLSGSLVAWGKLEERGIFKKDWAFSGLRTMNAILLFVAVLASVALVAWGGVPWAFVAITLVALVLGVTSVMPIGGADMPVVIALLNAYSGTAAAATGFVLSNPLLIIAGSLVGASGLILCQIMCKAMNRSLANVLFGGALSAQGTKTSADEVYAGKVKSASPEEVALMFDGARRVVIVPGYGMAVAQAQHAVRDLFRALEARGTDVTFAIHPVAGRMPGHMNVLLAEADIPYDRLKEMDESNSIMDQVDVALVVGANDVVNPVARTDPSSPIAGMPIIDVDRAKSCIVVKRSLSPGFAGIPNPLFAAESNVMLFADADKGIREVVAAVKEL